MNKTLLIVLGVLVALALIVGGWLMSGYNRVVTMDESVKTAWAQVDNQLKRRFDLIPNLVETVKGYAAHERGTFEHLADARTKYFQAKDVKGKIEATGDFERALSRLLVLQENYPQLKANETFLKMMDSLEGTENRLSVERKRYNDAVRTLNTYIRTVFGRFFAGLAGVSKAEYYQVPEAEKAAPKVKF
ncbi:MAG: LemA family protein [Deltaproteobacteria bacterium]|nr:LemA family protein [Deltaproteobacteria bacterium]